MVHTVRQEYFVPRGTYGRIGIQVDWFISTTWYKTFFPYCLYSIVPSYTSNDVGFWKAGGHLYRFSSYRSYLFLQRHDVELVCSDLQRVTPPILETFPKCIVITLLIVRPR